MGDFESSADVVAKLDERSLREARDDLEEALSSDPITVDVNAGGGQGGIADGGRDEATQALQAIERMWDESLRMADDRNVYLREIREAMDARRPGQQGGGGLPAGGIIDELTGAVAETAGDAALEATDVATDLATESVGTAVGTSVANAISGSSVGVSEPDWAPLEVKKPSWLPIEVGSPGGDSSGDGSGGLLPSPPDPEDLPTLPLPDPKDLPTLSLGDDVGPLKVKDPSPLEVEEIDPLPVDMPSSEIPVEDVGPISVTVSVRGAGGGSGGRSTGSSPPGGGGGSGGASERVPDDIPLHPVLGIERGENGPSLDFQGPLESVREGISGAKQVLTGDGGGGTTSRSPSGADLSRIGQYTNRRQMADIARDQSNDSTSSGGGGGGSGSALVKVVNNVDVGTEQREVERIIEQELRQFERSLERKLEQL